MALNYFFSASPSINQSYTVCAKDKMIVDVVFWIIIFHLNTFSVKWLEARIYEKEARALFRSWKKWLCRFYMISHGYLEYDSQKKVLRKFVFAMWCDFVLYFCLLFEENTFVRAAKFFFFFREAHKKWGSCLNIRHANCHEQPFTIFIFLEKKINVPFFSD